MSNYSELLRQDQNFMQMVSLLKEAVERHIKTTRELEDALADVEDQIAERFGPSADSYALSLVYEDFPDDDRIVRPLPGLDSCATKLLIDLKENFGIEDPYEARDIVLTLFFAKLLSRDSLPTEELEAFIKDWRAWKLENSVRLYHDI